MFITHILANMICNVLVTFLKLPFHFGVLVFHVQADSIQCLFVPLVVMFCIVVGCTRIVVAIDSLAGP